MKLTTKMTTSAIILGALALNGSSVLAAEKASYESNGIVEFTESNDITKPVDPTDPGEEVDPIDPTDPEGPNPGTPGPLSIDYASSLTFGKNKISNKNETYFANAQKIKDGSYRPNYVQVTDTRTGNLGWNLSVKQEGQFSNATATNKTLTGTTLQLASGTANSASTSPAAIAESVVTLDPAGATSVVMSAEKGSGWGTWASYYGTVENMEIAGETPEENETVAVNKAVTLSVPGATPKDAVKYSTKLTWILSDIPTEEE
ncbi:WxL domain-containing protein [Carnobacterium maltaromaticum]|uniref:WxL domain-containing protein n=1 Tax=Carnobacterium maltaromaticum TaxID=2751 RepID=UPI0012FAE396|nr:WxL domain-containing protein [Carnobacterium maltaromaticum]